MGVLIQIASTLLAGAAGSAGFLAGERLLSAISPGGQPLLGTRRRTRRRQMFTSTDLAQFAAAEAIGGKKAAVSLMMIRAARA